MKHLPIALTLLLAGVLARAEAAAPWQAKRAPLMTRWARDVSPTRVHDDYPRPTMVRREWRSLNGLWQFAVARRGEAPPVGRELGERILVPFPVESALSGVMRRAERVWYRRTFTVPRAWRAQRTLLHFGAVDWDATVWVNGRRLAHHRGGYDGFTVDVTPALRVEGTQELVVGVYDPSDAGEQPRGKQVRRPEGIWYTPVTGIWQSVWMEPVPPARIADLRIRPDVRRREVHISAGPVGRLARGAWKLEAEALDGGRVVARAETQLSGGPGRLLRLSVARPKLWSPEDPHLYDLRVRLRHGTRIVDAVGSYFAMRSVAVERVNGINRLTLNGRPVFQMGLLDQGYWPDGLYTAPTDAALRFDIEQAKRLGSNMLRKHAKVEPERWYYWADRLGMLVWQDMPSGNNRTPASRRQFEAELREMVQERWNHPSIIMWVVFNEGWGQYDTERLTRLVKKMDPTRIVNNASGWTDMKVGDVIDFHTYPAPSSPQPEATRAAVLGEFGGLGLGVDGHTWSSRNWGYQGMASREQLTSRYESLMRRTWSLHESPGLSAAVYTQLTDVETETNGLFTYDRDVLKVDPRRIVAANQGRLPRLRALLPTAETAPAEWRFTLARPAAGWESPGFDDSGWQRGRSGFGTRGTPGAIIGTEWRGSDIWLRREVTLTDPLPREVLLSLHHDEDAEVYLNGVLAAKVTGYTTGYEEVDISPAARAALRPGRNTLAIHCRQTTGGQYIDAGLVSLEPPGAPRR